MYTLYISDYSPYSIKASALLGYAGIPCRIARENLVNRYSVLKRLTGETMVPVLRRGDWAINDSTHIARWSKGRTERSLLPEDDARRAVCWLLEEFADEWVSRWVVHSRWCNSTDKQAVARAIGREATCEIPLVDRPVGALVGGMIQKGLARGGVRDENRAALEQSRDRTLQGLETLFDDADGYLFGAEPTVADFALYGQLEQYRRDPTGRSRMEMYPAIGEWLDDLDRMCLPHPVAPQRQGGHPELAELNVLFGELFGTYWRVLVETHRARARRDPPDDIEVELIDGTRFACRPSRYIASRLDFVLEHLDRLCAAEQVAIGPEALAIGDALSRAVDQLTAYDQGEKLLDGYPDLARVATGGER